MSMTTIEKAVEGRMLSLSVRALYCEERKLAHEMVREYAGSEFSSVEGLRRLLALYPRVADDSERLCLAVGISYLRGAVVAQSALTSGARK